MLTAAAGRRLHELDRSTALVTAILAGSPPQLAPCVQAALSELDRALAAARTPVPSDRAATT